MGYCPLILFLKLSAASNLTEEKKKKSEIELLVDNFASLFAVLSETTVKDQSKFTWKYYAPYFVEMKSQGHTKAFVYFVHQRAAITGVEEWLQQNQPQVGKFLEWSQAYRWPKI